MRIAPHWFFRRTPETKVLLFDFEYDCNAQKWFLVSDGLREEFIKPPSRGHYENWFAEAIHKRNEIRSMHGKPLIVGNLKMHSIEEIEREEAKLSRNRENILAALRNEKLPKNAGQFDTAGAELSSSALSEKSFLQARHTLFSV